ncbi:hypothetical protein [uncultured Campylobacter sp.]|uniref:hypothetical protein n=1 Tax=uncultured Campylobacter sp. TaxID=218934 RepID=UPI002615921A|nr:hypothetical protein [uncultured Campylobacter sp.]
MICPCCYLSAGAVSACCYDLDRLILGVDICARIDRYCAKRRRVASAQNMKAHRYKRSGQGKGRSAFLDVSRAGFAPHRRKGLRETRAV